MNTPINIPVPITRFSNYTDEWQLKSINQVTTKVSNAVNIENHLEYREIGIRSHGKGIFHKPPITGRELGNKRVFWVVNHALILNIVFAWEQAVAKTTDEEIGMIASHRFPMYLPSDNQVNIDFLLWFFLRKEGKYLLELASPGGAGRNKTLGQSAFGKLLITIPSVTEQQKIATFLTLVHSWIVNLKSQEHSLKSYKKSVMQKIFSQITRFKDDDGKYYPEWRKQKIGDLGNIFNGLTGKSAIDFGLGEPFITYKQIFDHAEIDSNFGLVNIGVMEKQNRAQFGDVFFTSSSETPDEVGFASVLLNKNTTPYLNSFSFGFRANSLKELDPGFAKHLFRSPGYRREVIKLAQGSTRYNISKVGFAKIPVFLPTLLEQQKIANFLNIIDKNIESKQNQIKNADIWKKGLMQRMFV